MNNQVKIYFIKKNIIDLTGTYKDDNPSITSNKESYSEYYDIDDSFSFLIDDLKITFEDNKSHTTESYMIKLQNKDFKIIYTSDIGTTNIDKLTNFCKDADLLICESSFLLRHNANSKTHMTAYDASTLANKSNAKKLLLTHFWPEEDKKLYLEEARKKITESHTAQTKVLQQTIADEEFRPNILFTHAQDTLMTVMSEINVGKQLVRLYKKVNG